MRTAKILVPKEVFTFRLVPAINFPRDNIRAVNNYLNVSPLGVYELQNDLPQFLRVGELPGWGQDDLGGATHDAARGAAGLPGLDGRSTEAGHLFGGFEQIFYLEGIGSGAYFDAGIGHGGGGVLRVGRVAVFTYKIRKSNYCNN